MGAYLGEKRRIQGQRVIFGLLPVRAITLVKEKPGRSSLGGRHRKTRVVPVKRICRGEGDQEKKRESLPWNPGTRITENIKMKFVT